MVAKSIAFSQAAQSVALAASSETQIPISCGVASLTMTADQSPTFPPLTVVASALPARAHMSPFLPAQSSLTEWVPLPICVTAEPDTVAPSTIASTFVVAACPSIWNWTVPPNAPLCPPADAAGAALFVAPEQPPMRSALTRTPRIVRMPFPPIGSLTI